MAPPAPSPSPPRPASSSSPHAATLIAKSIAIAILIGEQYSTNYLAIKQQAETSAELAVAAAQGKSAPSGLAEDTVNNGAKDVPSVLLSPIAVTKDNIADTVIKDGLLTTDEICTGR